MTVSTQPKEKVSLLKLPDAFTRVMRQRPKYRWWKPILVIPLAFVFLIIFQLILMVAIAALQATLDLETFASNLQNGTIFGFGASEGYLGIDATDPFAMAFALLGVATMLPAIVLASKILGLGGFGSLSSVTGKLRLSALAKLAPWAIVPMLIYVALSIGIPYAINPAGADLGPMKVVPAALIVILLCTPLQCAAEEYAFRGFALQTFGSWIPVVVIPLLLQAALFAVVHSYNWLGNINIAFMGLFMGYLTIKTGGLEASILMHTSNNLVALLLQSLFVSQTVQADVTAEAVVFEVIVSAILMACIMWGAKRNGLLLPDNQPVEEPTPESQAAPQPQAQPASVATPQVRFCYNCGMSLMEGASFCHNCGAEAYKGY